MRGIPPELSKMVSLLREENGVAKIMLQEVYGEGEDGEPTVSQAELVADAFNVFRLDCRRLGQAAGIDLPAERMTPERAAMMLQGLVKGDDLSLIEAINQIEARHDAILEALEDEEAVEEHRATKESVLFHKQDRDESGGEDVPLDEVDTDVEEVENAPET